MPNPGNPSVIVDDRSALIKYAGQWKQDGASLEFAGTTSDSNTLGSTATFIFDGTSIVVFGTINADAGTTMNFAIDKTITGSFKTPTTLPAGFTALHHQPLYTSPTLPAGRHTLVITHATTTIAAHIFLDYFIYTPSPASASTSLTYLVDDNDPLVQYDNWTANQEDRDVQHTFHQSGAEGAKITFAFEGTGVSIFGDIPKRLIVANMATISVDNGPPVNFAPPIQILTDFTLGQQIYNSPKLTQGNHTLVLTTVGADPLLVDYFLVVPGEITRPTPTPSSTTSAASTAATKTTKAPATSSSSSSPSQTAASSTASSTNVGAIAGGSIGALIALALLFALFMFWRKRKSVYNDPMDRISLTSERYAVQPFTSPMPSHAYPPSQPSSQYTPSAYNYPAPSTYAGSNHAGYGAGEQAMMYAAPVPVPVQQQHTYGHQHTRSTGSQPTVSVADHRSGYNASPMIIQNLPPLRDVKRRPPSTAAAYDAYEPDPAGSMLPYDVSPPSSPVSHGTLPNPHPDNRPPPTYTPD